MVADEALLAPDLFPRLVERVAGGAADFQSVAECRGILQFEAQIRKIEYGFAVATHGIADAAVAQAGLQCQASVGRTDGEIAVASCGEQQERGQRRDPG